MIRVLLLVLLVSFGVEAAAQSASSLTFPRLGLIGIGSPQDYDNPERQAQLSRYEVVVINTWPGWDSGRAMGLEASVRAIKARNPRTKVFLYVANNEFDDRAAQTWPELWGKLNANGWWLYERGGGGTRVKSTWGDAHYLINNTEFSPRDSSGESFIDFFARYAVATFLSTTPSADGLYLDNMFWKPRNDGDWNRDGQIDDQNNATVQTWMRQGLRRQIEAFRARAPGKQMIGNIADWGEPSAPISEFSGLLDGGVMESIIGQSYSVESWGGWAAMMAQYRKMLYATTGPRLTIFGHDGKAGDYRGFRYGFASCLMDDGVFHYGANFSPPYAWFDEYDVKLGKALAGPSTTAWRQGVYRRDFEGGIVLVNPKGNGAVTVDLEQDYRRIDGTQDRSVNDGQLTRRVTLQDRDGIVLIRVAARAVPLPPSDLRVE
jgi:hypothetical protein